MNRVTLQSGNAKLVIDPNGGYIEEYSMHGEPILFAAEIRGKRRATHVCVPNFGPDASGQWEQHGFGRKVHWQIALVEEDKMRLKYLVGEGRYAGLDCELEYALAEDHLTMKLACHNNGENALWLAPGFHPYFVVPEGVNEVRFDEQRYCIDNLAGSEYIATDTSTHTIGLGHRTVRMTSENLKTVVLWSEEPSRFVCVEPTLNGNSFFDHTTPPGQELLAPGETKDYSFSLLI